MRRSPSTADVSPWAKLLDARGLLRWHVDRRRLPPEPVMAFRDAESYTALLERYTGRTLSDSRVLEIGYGSRPWRLRALLAMGIDVIGVDAEVPVLEGRLAEYREALRRNGVERALKSLARHMLFDRRDLRIFRSEVRRRGLSESVDRSRFLVDDAAELELPAGSFDLILSEEVFEHVERRSLERLVPKMAGWLDPGGLALIRPNVFTGISGGHRPEWYPYTFEVHPARRRRTEPWEHLRRDRRPPNTFLNRLSRADYRELFAGEFEILEEIVKRPHLGREELTPEVAAELRSWTEDELFSNEVMFVLRPRPESPPSRSMT